MPTALFDGACIICRSASSAIAALDWMNRVEFRDLHDPDLRSRYPELSDDQLMGAIHVLAGDGRLYIGYDGIRRLLKEIPLGLPIWLLLHLPGMDGMGRRVYQFIARRRYRMNRLFGRAIPDCADGCRPHPNQPRS